MCKKAGLIGDSMRSEKSSRSTHGISCKEDILNSERSYSADHSFLGCEMVNVTGVLKAMLSSNKIAFILVVMVILWSLWHSRFILEQRQHKTLKRTIQTS